MIGHPSVPPLPPQQQPPPTPPHPTLIPPSPTVNEILPKTLGFVKSVPDLIRSDTATEFQAVVSVSGGRSVNHDTFYGGANIANKKFLSGGEREREKKNRISAERQERRSVEQGSESFRMSISKKR